MRKVKLVLQVSSLWKRKKKRGQLQSMLNKPLILKSKDQPNSPQRESKEARENSRNLMHKLTSALTSFLKSHRQSFETREVFLDLHDLLIPLKLIVLYMM